MLNFLRKAVLSSLLPMELSSNYVLAKSSRHGSNLVLQLAQETITPNEED